jgi:hypothetical protein
MGSAPNRFVVLARGDFPLVCLDLTRKCNEIDLKRKERKSMSEKNSVVAIYATHSQAEEAVKELQRSGFDMKKMSIVGKH